MAIETDAVMFELEHLELVDGERVEVGGRWYGVRGRRFVRPTLTVGSSRMLALLDHKPWSADDGEHWVAAFPWTDGADDLGGAELAVAPDIAVSLPVSLPETSADEPPRVTRVAPAPVPAKRERDLRGRAERVERVERALADERAENDRLRAELGRATATELEAETARDEAFAAHDRTRAELKAAVAERDRLSTERDRLAAERDGLVAERDRLSTERDRLSTERDRLAAERDGLAAERDRLTGERDRPVAAPPKPRRSAPRISTSDWLARSVAGLALILIFILVLTIVTSS